MGIAEAFAIFVAGAAAGTVNAVVGSGSLITFPTLLAFGFPPVVANVSNNVGLVPGNFSGAWGYRRELAGQRARLVWLGMFSVLGAVAGAAALLALPAGAFKVVVPVLILASCVLVLLQPRLSARIAARRKRARDRAAAQGHDGQPRQPRQPRQPGQPGQPGPPGQADGAADRADRGGAVLAGGMLGAAVYGGYFGAAQGVLVIGLLGTFLDESMQRINGAKNVLVGMVNGSAAVVYVLFAHVNWMVVVLIAVGSTLGGLLGARIGRRLPPLALRIFIVAIGLIAAIRLIIF